MTMSVRVYVLTPFVWKIMTGKGLLPFHCRNCLSVFKVGDVVVSRHSTNKTFRYCRECAIKLRLI